MGRDVVTIGVDRIVNQHERAVEQLLVAAQVAAAAFWAWNEMPFADDIPLGAAMTEVVLPRRSRFMPGHSS